MSGKLQSERHNRDITKGVWRSICEDIFKHFLLYTLTDLRLRFQLEEKFKQETEIFLRFSIFDPASSPKRVFAHDGLSYEDVQKLILLFVTWVGSSALSFHRYIPKAILATEHTVVNIRQLTGTSADCVCIQRLALENSRDCWTVSVMFLLVFSPIACEVKPISPLLSS